MDDTLRIPWLAAETLPAQDRPKFDWPLMGDIVSHRAGIPEHLIQWHRAMGEKDPKPQP